MCSRDAFLDNWLVNLTGKPNSFKEVDLMGEHLNFWAKVCRSRILRVYMQNLICVDHIHGKGKQ